MTTDVIDEISYGKGSASLGIQGGFDPAIDVEVSGIVTVPYSAILKGTGERIEGRLRIAEALVVADIARKLSTYETVLAERDSLLADKRAAEVRYGSVAGYTTAEVMLNDQGDRHPRTT